MHYVGTIRLSIATLINATKCAAIRNTILPVSENDTIENKKKPLISYPSYFNEDGLFN